MNKFNLISLFAIIGALLPADCFCANTLKLCEENSLPGYNYTAVAKRMESKPRQRIEGIWRLTDTNTLVAIEATDDGQYNMVVITAPDRRLLPGTPLGTLTRAGNPDMYTGKMYTRLKGDLLFMPKSFSARLHENQGLLEFMRHKSTVRINLWHFVPFLYRNSISTTQSNAKAHHGCVRVFPEPDIPVEPVYL